MHVLRTFLLQWIYIRIDFVCSLFLKAILSYFYYMPYYSFVNISFSVLSTYSRLSLSRIPRDSLKYFEISVVRHIRFAELRKKLIRLTTFNKYMCNWTLKFRYKLKILWKRGEIAP